MKATLTMNMLKNQIRAQASVKTDVAIVGGGPGGISTAIALKKACPGINVKVYERANYNQPMGAGLRVSSTGMSALRSIDPALAQTVIDNSFGCPKAKILDPSGNIIKSTHLVSSNAVISGWWELVQSLLSHLHHDDIVYDAGISHVSEDTGSVLLHFEDEATAPVEAKLVIGCDGYTSKIASENLNLPLNSHEVDTIAWRARVPGYGADRLQLGDDNVGFIMGDGVIITYLPVSESGDVCWNVGITSQLQQQMGIDSLYGNSPEERKQQCLDVLIKGGYPQEIIDVVSATEAKSIRAGGLYARLPEDLPESKLGDGRISLLGDALHAMRPTSGCGGNFAIEDACILAHCVHQYGATSDALRAYEAQRLPRAKEIVADTLNIGRQVWTIGADIVRNATDNNTWQSFPFLHYDMPKIQLPNLHQLGAHGANGFWSSELGWIDTHSASGGIAPFTMTKTNSNNTNKKSSVAV